MWLFGQIFLYLLAALMIGAAGSWIYRGRLAADSQEHLRQRFRQMVGSSEMERDAAKLQVRELKAQLQAFGVRPKNAEVTKALGQPATDVASSTIVEAEAPGAAGMDEEVEVVDVGALAPDEQDDLGQGYPADRVVSAAAAPRITNGAVPVADEAPSGLETLETDGAANPHPLSDLGEIPPEISKRLRALGVNNTGDLSRYFKSGPEPGALASVLGVESRKVRRWRVLADLLEVPELRPEHAWLLEISGLGSATELAAEDPDELAARMAGLNEDQDLGLPVPEPGMVAQWVRWASGLTETVDAE